MDSRKRSNRVQQVIGLVSGAAAIAIAIPLSAQSNPAPGLTQLPEQTPSSIPNPAIPSPAPTAVPGSGSLVTPGTPSTNDPVKTPIESGPTSVPSEPTADSLTAPSEPGAANPSTAPDATATSSQTITAIAAASDTFKTLTAALTEAELAEVLQGEGPFTVFAPTDAAFAALPTGTLEELLKPENREKLVKILKYHVVSGAITSAQLTSGEVKTVEGSSLKVTVTPTGVTVNDATVTQPDILASNGVIHTIDQVVLPPDL